jgi:hypothetical protein
MQRNDQRHQDILRLAVLPLLGTTLALLQGCANLTKPAAPVARCDQAAVQFALGQSFGPQLEREVRARSGAQQVRWLSPGQMVTMEFNPGRLNLTLDGRGQVVKASCG